MNSKKTLTGAELHRKTAQRLHHLILSTKVLHPFIPAASIRQLLPHQRFRHKFQHKSQQHQPCMFEWKNSALLLD